MNAHVWSLLAAIAQSSTAAPSSGLGGKVFFVEIAILIAVFYFFVMRPQSTQRKRQEETLRALKKGDEVTTAGGIVGEVIYIKQTVKDGAAAPSMDDRITIKSAESRLIVERGRIARVSSKTAESESTAS
ncbi:MAG TPA: preprotein translocase subunit YajC [Gemmatimonadaceae bacterium]|jgi:preprotein translocase subunit YajC|nr:preprotein translocase subunit YajC [Gemmatimonadaceae bacterium]